jgi:addiction module HigA family antidote
MVLPTRSKPSTIIEGPVVFGPLHPGEVLREEYADPLGLHVEDLANALKVDVHCIGALLEESAPLTAELALRLGRHFRTTPQFWMNLQSRFDLETARRAHGERIEREVQPRNP